MMTGKTSSAPYPKTSVSAIRRALFRKLIDDCADCIPLCFMMHKNNPNHLDEMVKWLIRNQITGKKFVEYFAIEMNGSPLKLFATLNGKIERAEIRPLFAGRDF